MLIHCNDGSSCHGVIVGLTGTVMRVAVAGCEGVSDFTLMNGAWVWSDRCEVVSFEFPPGLTEHEYFKAAVTEAIKPIKSLPGYLGKNDWVPENVN